MDGMILKQTTTSLFHDIIICISQSSIIILVLYNRYDDNIDNAWSDRGFDSDGRIGVLYRFGTQD
jgi:hypothetical protein